MPDNLDLERRVTRLEEWRIHVDKALGINGNGSNRIPATWTVVLLAIIAALAATGLLLLVIRL